MLRKVCFFNYLHNGDIFTGKAYVQAIMRAYPGFDYAYALGASPESAQLPLYDHAAGTRSDVIKDLRCYLITCDQLPEGGPGWYDRVAVWGDWLLVNSWIGAYAADVFPPGEEHANYPSLQRMWAMVFDEVNAVLGTRLTISADIWDAVPTTDWSVYNCAAADRYLAAQRFEKRLLFCNGPARSHQSVWAEDDMRGVIEPLADQHPDWDFICTQPFPSALPNVHFTDDIFQQDCDINEIAYLSTHCDLIWSKVSGPYIYCHVPENMFDPTTTFFSSSDRPSDSLPFGCEDLRCRYYHSLTGDPATLIGQINAAMAAPAAEPPAGSMIVLP